MKKFTLGVLAGMSSLAVAVPMLASVAGAQSSATTRDTLKERPIPTQACVQAMADQEGTMLSKIDAMIASHKTILAAHQKALDAAADIADDTARSEAVKKAHEDMRAAMEAAKPAEDTTAVDALKTACGDSIHGLMGGPGFGMMMGGPKGGHHGGMMKMDLGEKLGMTEVELKAAIDSGKSIEDIAAEKGITLPARPEKGMMRGGMFERPADAPAEAVQQ